MRLGSRLLALTLGAALMTHGAAFSAPAQSGLPLGVIKQEIPGGVGDFQVNGNGDGLRRYDIVTVVREGKELGEAMVVKASPGGFTINLKGVYTVRPGDRVVFARHPGTPLAQSPWELLMEKDDGLLKESCYLETASIKSLGNDEVTCRMKTVYSSGNDPLLQTGEGPSSSFMVFEVYRNGTCSEFTETTTGQNTLTGPRTYLDRASRHASIERGSIEEKLFQRIFPDDYQRMK
jgi:hypothetical protein